MIINPQLRAVDLQPKLDRFWKLSGDKIRRIEKRYDPSRGAPVFTARGRYTARGWTEWTQGFQYGSAILQFDATGEQEFLEIGRQRTAQVMAPHLTHFGVHDHGFNNVSTYGNLLRLMNEGRIAENAWERRFYELALKVSGAVQAKRWTDLGDHRGFIHSFNGPHSLFVDTIRSLRALALAHKLGQPLCEENDLKIPLLARLKAHATATARYSVYYGEGRDSFDIRGRVVHEAIFNVKNGSFRCPSTQQGYSPFSTWTRGLAWAITGFAEELEFLNWLGDREITAELERAARATCDFYIDQGTAADGIPYWDTGAPGLDKLGDWRATQADPYNDYEPVDSSAAAIAAQGLMRLAHYLGKSGKRYHLAGLTVLDRLLDDPYLSTQPAHEGLLLHSVYHRPNGWDYIPRGCKVPCGESSMWGDYHLREAALYAQRLAKREPYLTFFG